jgi:hypothetical protein
MSGPADREAGYQELEAVKFPPQRVFVQALPIVDFLVQPVLAEVRRFPLVQIDNIGLPEASASSTRIAATQLSTVAL